MLFTASSRNWYSTPCASPSPEPSSTTSMKIPQATAKPVSTVRSLLRVTVSRISCQVSRSIIRPRAPWRSGRRAVPPRDPDAGAGGAGPAAGGRRRAGVLERFDLDDDVVRVQAALVGCRRSIRPSTRWMSRSVMCGDVALVGDDDHRHALVLDRLQDLHDVARGRRVERAGRLVGEQELGAGDQRAGDRDALLLAAGELARQVLGAVGEADPLEVDRGALGCAPGAARPGSRAAARRSRPRS